MRRLITSRYYAAKTVVVDRLRRGERMVLLPPDGTRFGNLLYLWLQAQVVRAAGTPAFVLATPVMRSWLEAFPALQELTIEQEELRFHDARVWDGAREFYQRFGIDFTRDQLHAFVRDRLAGPLAREETRPLVVNVRRGDYYSVPAFRRLYGMDVVDYVRRARSRIDGARETLVVSDDIPWCREHLGPMLTSAGSAVAFAGGGPVADFRAIARAQVLIGTNSTFSYWGGYTSSALVPCAQVIMPSFHSTVQRAVQLDPRWTAIAAAPVPADTPPDVPL